MYYFTYLAGSSRTWLPFSPPCRLIAFGFLLESNNQMKATKATRAAVQMTVREREMNGRVLRLLQSDRKLQQKVRYVQRPNNAIL